MPGCGLADGKLSQGSCATTRRRYRTSRCWTAALASKPPSRSWSCGRSRRVRYPAPPAIKVQGRSCALRNHNKSHDVLARCSPLLHFSSRARYSVQSAALLGALTLRASWCTLVGCPAGTRSTRRTCAACARRGACGAWRCRLRMRSTGSTRSLPPSAAHLRQGFPGQTPKRTRKNFNPARIEQQRYSGGRWTSASASLPPRPREFPHPERWRCPRQQLQVRICSDLR